MSAPIIVLPDSLVKQMAAGQVIDRPAAVVKELVENSLDAQATAITINLLKSGLKSIEVIDNGVGIPADQLLTSVQHHATSKLDPAVGLNAISTLGFRGDALASIASSANLSLSSRPPNQTSGFQISLSKLTKPTPPEPIGMPTGTRAVVTQLFTYHPQRTHFLKSPSSELADIISTVSQLALSMPATEFQIFNDGKEVFHTKPQSNSSDRLRALLGLAEDDLLSMQYEAAHFTLRGALGKPFINHASGRHLYWMVNRRPVSDPKLTQVLRRSLHHVLDMKKYPIGVLELTLPSELVDINQHPQKQTVNFAPQAQVYQHLENAIAHTLKTNYLVADPEWQELRDSEPSFSRQIADVLKSRSLTWEATQTRTPQEIFQAHDVYLIFAQPDGSLRLVDQHAAHERILYEELLASYSDARRTTPPQTLDEPISVTLPANDMEIFLVSQSTFSSLQFEVTQTSPQTVAIRAIPTTVDTQVAAQVFREILSDLMDEVPLQDIDNLTHRTIAYLACRTAVKAGDRLSPAERVNLIEKLNQTKNPWTCPHGRPIQVSLTKAELEKRFGRV